MVCRFACLSVYLSVDHVCEPCKTTEPIKMQFGLGGLLRWASEPGEVQIHAGKRHVLGVVRYRCVGTCAKTEQLVYRNVDDVKDNIDDVKRLKTRHVLRVVQFTEKHWKSLLRCAQRKGSFNLQ